VSTWDITKWTSANALPATTGTAQSAGHISRLTSNGNNTTLDIGTDATQAWIKAVDKTNLATNRNLLLNPNGGNVGIGTTNPTRQLETNGTVAFTGIGTNTVDTNVMTTDALGNVTTRTLASLNAATTVSNTSVANNLSTTVNGVTGANVSIINTNALGLASGVLTSTVNGVPSGTVNVLETADNGLTVTAGKVQLGGALIKPTTISAVDATNFLAVTATGVNAINLDSNTLSVDATNNRIGVGTAAPTEVLDVVGNVKFSGALMPNNLPGTTGQILTSQGAGVAPIWTDYTANAIITKTANYTGLTTDETILVDATAGVVTITLPASATGKKYNVKKIDATVNAVSVTATAGTIDGNASISGTLPWQGWIMQFDGTNWFVIGRI